MVLQPGNQLLLVLGAALILAAVGLRPRLGTVHRIRRRSTCLEREQAPALYALTDRIAAELGTAPIYLIRVSADYNAFYARIGLRRRPVLTLGLPLWETLSAQERVALLSHELGHGANGDSSRGIWIGSALNCLELWYTLLVPGRRMLVAGRSRGSRGALLAIGELIARILLFAFAEVALTLHRLLRRATVVSTRRGEYLADSLAVRIAGNAASAELLQRLGFGRSVNQVRQQRKFAAAATPRRRGQAATTTPAPPRVDFWTDLRAYVDSIPESERARRLVVSEQDDSATDATHPPTHLRISFVRSQPESEPLIVLSPAELASVETELAPARATIAAQLERADR